MAMKKRNRCASRQCSKRDFTRSSLSSFFHKLLANDLGTDCIHVFPVSEKKGEGLLDRTALYDGGRTLIRQVFNDETMTQVIKSEVTGLVVPNKVRWFYYLNIKGK